MCRVMNGYVDILKQIFSKAEHDMKDYTDRGGCYQLRPKAGLITCSEIWIIVTPTYRSGCLNPL